MRLRFYIICCLKPSRAVDEAVITGGCSPTCNVARTDEGPCRDLSTRSSYTCNYIKESCDKYGAIPLALGPTVVEGRGSSSRYEKTLAKICTNESVDDSAACGLDRRSDRGAELRDAVAAAVRATVTPALTGVPQLRPLLRDLALGECIGAGRSGGKVFKGIWQGRDAAVKLTVASSVDHLHVTAREALLSRSLSHPHLVQTYAVHVGQLSSQDLDPDTYMLPNPTADPPRWMGGLAAPGIQYSGNSLVTNELLTPRGRPDAHVPRSDSETMTLTAGAPTSPRTACAAPRPDTVDVEPTTVSLTALSPSREPAPASAPVQDSNATRFLRELQAMGAAPGCYLTCLVMELCDQGTLLQLIDKLHEGRAGDRPSSRQRARSVRTRPSVIRQAFPVREHWSGASDLGGSDGRPQSSLCPGALLGELEAARVAGEESADGTARGGPEASKMLWIALDIARGMNHLHAEDLIHVDLKPGNVLLSRAVSYDTDPDTDGGSLPYDTKPWLLNGGARLQGFRCKVADFGLTTPTSASGHGSSLSEGGSSDLGAVAYLAPEVAAGAVPDKTADVYSYGALLWHMATGVKPHASLRRSQIVVGLASGELALTWPHWAEPTLRKIGSACMAPEPARRPTFEHIVQELEQAVQASAPGGSPTAHTDYIRQSQHQGSAEMNPETP